MSNPKLEEIIRNDLLRETMEEKKVTLFFYNQAIRFKKLVASQFTHTFPISSLEEISVIKYKIYSLVTDDGIALDENLKLIPMYYVKPKE